MNNYEIILYWDKVDEFFIAEIPELKGCIAHGQTEFEAIANINEAKQLWIETALEFNDPIPEPKGRLMFA
jgi:predicted RNase H-like HicB family nuclease